MQYKSWAGIFNTCIDTSLLHRISRSISIYFARIVLSKDCGLCMKKLDFYSFDSMWGKVVTVTTHRSVSTWYTVYAVIVAGFLH